MARVTVEDCIEKIPNRFDLVLAAAQRAGTFQLVIRLQLIEIMIKTQLLHCAK